MQHLPAYQTAHLNNLIGAFVATVGDDLTAASECGIGAGGSEPAALLAIDTWPAHSIDFLRGVLGLSHSGAVRLVARLEESGLVERSAGTDGRVVILGLTRAGRALALRVRRLRRTVLSDIVVELDTDERRVLEKVLDRALRITHRTRTQARHACRLCDHSVCCGDECPVGSSVNVE